MPKSSCFSMFGSVFFSEKSGKKDPHFTLCRGELCAGVCEGSCNVFCPPREDTSALQKQTREKMPSKKLSQNAKNYSVTCECSTDQWLTHSCNMQKSCGLRPGRDANPWESVKKLCQNKYVDTSADANK